MATYRSKLPTVEAMVWTGHRDDDELVSFATGWVQMYTVGGEPQLLTPSGPVAVAEGCVVVKHALGVFACMTPAYFAAVYEACG